MLLGALAEAVAQRAPAVFIRSRRGSAYCSVGHDGLHRTLRRSLLCPTRHQTGNGSARETRPRDRGSLVPRRDLREAGLSQSSPEAPNPPGYAPVGRTLKLPRGTLIKVLLAPLGGSSPSCIRRWIAMAAELRRQVVAMSAADRSSTFRSGKQFHRPYASGTMAEAGRTIGTWSSDRG